MFAEEEENQSANQLIALLKKSQDRIIQLEKENELYRNGHKSMRRALEQARIFIQTSQTVPSLYQNGRLRKFATPVIRLSQRILFASKWPARAGRKSYISRSRLEKELLNQSRKTISGIEGVVVDFVRGEKVNWRVCGIASGAVDAAEALKAVLDASRSFEACELVNDGSPLDGRPVKARPPAPQESPTRPTQGRSIFR